MKIISRYLMTIASTAFVLAFTLTAHSGGTFAVTQPVLSDGGSGSGLFSVKATDGQTLADTSKASDNFGISGGFWNFAGSVPIVTTLAPSFKAATSATLNGSANPNGESTTGWFRYSSADPGSCNDMFGTRAPVMGGAGLGSGTMPAQYSEAITGLMPGATYYYCAIAANGSGTSFGSVLSFTAGGSPPDVTTSAATSVNVTSATLNGVVNSNGDATVGWFRYSSSDPGTCNDMFGTRAPIMGGTAVGSNPMPIPYSQGISGLMPGGTYYFCAIASNSSGTSFGNVLMFVAAPSGPSVATSAATSVTVMSATLNGSANPNGDASTGWFRYGQIDPGACNDTFGTRAPIMGGTALGSGNMPVGYSQGITGLNAGSTYYFCAIASNSSGTSFGSVLSFVAAPSGPSVTTNAATSVTVMSATLNGSANPNSDATVGWFRYSSFDPGTCNDMFGTRAPVMGGTALGSGIMPVPYSEAIGGLNPGTTYYFCAIASNSSGTSFGSVLSFSGSPASVSGTITYGNAIGNPMPPRFVKNVSVASTSGMPPVGPVITSTPGTYILTGFGAGSYTIKPTKPGGATTAVTSNDAARVAQGVSASVPFVSLNQKFASDASGNGTVSSNDAALIARFAAGLSGTGNVGQWKFFTANLAGPPTAPLPTPPYNDSRIYASVTSSMTGEDFVGLLIGEASGNYNPATHPRPTGKAIKANSEDSTAEAKPIMIAAPYFAAGAEKEIVVPVSVEGVTGKEIISYEFDLHYDPSVIQPIENPIELAGTVSRGLLGIANPNEPGLMRIVVYGPMPINENGVLLNLKFMAVGRIGSLSPLTFERLMFNEGEPRIEAVNGQIEITD